MLSDHGNFSSPFFQTAQKLDRPHAPPPALTSGTNKRESRKTAFGREPSAAFFSTHIPSAIHKKNRKNTWRLYFSVRLPRNPDDFVSQTNLRQKRSTTLFCGLGSKNTSAVKDTSVEYLGRGAEAEKLFCRF
ncbi:MAG: hypothetical protein IJ793_01215 [Opitutales bacterium]|nr:hypothetical protein [Opitutales bacterium]